MAGDTVATIIGTLCADPELKFLPSGAAVANFTVASNSRRLDKETGKWEDADALFMRCAIWRQYAENVSESLRKGDRVIVTGRLKQRSWEKDGVKHTVIEMDVDEIGPTLRFATVKVNKASRDSGSSGPSEDPWASGSTPARSTGASGWDAEPPF